MNKALINYFVDIGLAITFVSSAVTGIIKFPRLLSLVGLQLRALPMREISAVHDWSGIVMVVLVLVHLILHWQWIVCMTKSFFNKPEQKQKH